MLKSHYLFVFGIGMALFIQAMNLQSQDARDFETAQTLQLSELAPIELEDTFSASSWLEDTLSTPLPAWDLLHEELSAPLELVDRSVVRHYRHKDRRWIEERTCPESPYFTPPAHTAITSHFGKRVHPITGKAHIHSGVDYNGPIGQPIQASAPGQVVHVGPKGAYGRTVIVDHGDRYSSLYGHLSGYNVQSGEWVNQGQTLGYIGRSGRATGPHLHFEIRCFQMPIDPAPYIGRQGLTAKVKVLGRAPRMSASYKKAKAKPQKESRSQASGS